VLGDGLAQFTERLIDGLDPPQAQTPSQLLGHSLAHRSVLDRDCISLWDVDRASSRLALRPRLQLEAERPQRRNAGASDIPQE